MENPSIGMFDSGVGGLSVWKEVMGLLPYESIFYYADNRYCPYGNKEGELIVKRTRYIIDFLLAKKCKLIVIACNSATAAAVDLLRKEYKVPFVAMEPAVKQASLNTITGHIGVLATDMTLQGRQFNETSRKFAEGLDVHVQVGHGLVEIIESGRIDTPETEALLRRYLEPMIAKQVDQLVLGCTHYPFLIPVIRRIVPERMNVIDPSSAVARQVKNVLGQHDLLVTEKRPPHYFFYTSGDPVILKQFLAQMTDAQTTVQRD